jgi:outer membrane protein assembly factor BamB
MMPLLIMAFSGAVVALLKMGRRWPRVAGFSALGAVFVSTVYLFPLWVGFPVPSGFYHGIFWSPTWNAKIKPAPPRITHVAPFTQTLPLVLSQSPPTAWLGFENGGTHDTAYSWPKDKPLAAGYVLHMPGPVADQPAIAGGDAYVGSNGDALKAWNLSTGKTLWTDTLPNMVMTTPLVAGQNVIVGLGNNAFRSFSSSHGWIRGSGTNGVMDFNRRTGKELWYVPTEGEDMPTLAMHQGTVYEATGDGRLIGINASTGKLVWSLRLSGFDSMSSPVISGDMLYVATNVYMKAYPASASTLWAINLATRSVAWKSNLPVASGLSDCSPIVSHGILYIAGVPRIVNVSGGKTWLNNEVFAINTQNGQILWSHQTGGGILNPDEEEVGIPAVVGKGLYIGNPAAKTLQAYNATSGQLLWKLDLPSGLTANPVASGSVLWLALHDGAVMEVDVDSGSVVQADATGLGKMGPAAPVVFPNAVLLASLSGNVGMIPLVSDR